MAFSMRSKFPTNGVLQFLFPWRQAHFVKQAAGDVVQQCRADLWQRVDRRTANMSLSEIRGYARALAAGFVADQLDHSLCCHGLKPALRSRVADAAVDQLIGMVVHGILSGALPANTKPMAA
jgi:hypothetical protein